MNILTYIEKHICNIDWGCYPLPDQRKGLPLWLSGFFNPLQGRRQETQAPSLGQEDPLEEEMVALSSILAWKIPRIREPGGLQSMQLQRVESN